MHLRPLRAFLSGLLVVSAIAALPWPATADEEKKDDPIAAIVNGEEIRVSEVTAAKDRLSGQVAQLPMDVLYPLLLGNLVDTRLLSKGGRAANLQDDPEYKQTMALVERQLLGQMFLSSHVKDVVTEDAVRARYDQTVATQTGKQEVKARHILVETEEKAKEVIEELKGGADFEELAKNRSVGPSAASGGDLGYFEKDAMVPAFADAAFALEKDAFSENPVKTQFGWHVIKVEDKRDVQPPDFEDVSQQLRSELVQEATKDLMDELRAGAEISRFNMDGTPMVDPAAPAAEPAAEQPTAEQPTAEQPKAQ